MLIGAGRKGKRCQVGGAISPGHVSRCHFAARRYFAKHLFMLFWTARVPPNALTGVGKIYKHPLRREAAQRAFEAAIAPLREEGMAAVTVRDDPSRGMLAAVQISAPAGAVSLEPMPHMSLLLEVVAQGEVQKRRARRDQLHRRRQPALHDRRVARSQV